jgi:hypothetical protein
MNFVKAYRTFMSIQRTPSEAKERLIDINIDIWQMEQNSRRARDEGTVAYYHYIMTLLRLMRRRIRTEIELEEVMAETLIDAEDLESDPLLDGLVDW